MNDTAIDLVDAQIHAWAPDSPERPWSLRLIAEELHAQVRAHFSHDVFTHERVVDELDRNGVSAAVIVNPSIYGDDLSYSFAAARIYAGRFRVVAAALDSEAEDLEEVVGALRWNPSFAAVRIQGYTQSAVDAVRHGSTRRIVEAASRTGTPVNVYMPGHLDVVAELARDFSDVQFIVDHFGLLQPPVFLDWSPPDPFAGLHELVRLARYQNVAVKATSLPSLSHEPFPYLDLWPALETVLTAFGVHRVMWGTDFTRVAERVTYEQGLMYMLGSDRLSDADKASVMGANARRIYNWS